MLTVGGEVLAFVDIRFLSRDFSGSGILGAALRPWNDFCFVIALYSVRNAARYTLLSIVRYCVR